MFSCILGGIHLDLDDLDDYPYLHLYPCITLNPTLNLTPKSKTLYLKPTPKALKEYYEIVGESCPLSAFLQKCISNHETKQSSKFQSDPSPNCFTIDV